MPEFDLDAALLGEHPEFPAHLMTDSMREQLFEPLTTRVQTTDSGAYAQVRLKRERPYPWFKEWWCTVAWLNPATGVWER